MTTMRATLRAHLPERRLEWIEDGRILEITAFHDPGLFPAFALPTALPPTRR
jgi:hypothetical protein